MGSRLVFEDPGDEYGAWIVASWPSIWFVVVIGSSGDLHEVLRRTFVAGFATLWLCGAVMAWLRVSARTWTASALFCGVLSFCVLTGLDPEAPLTQRLLRSATSNLASAWVGCLAVAAARSRAPARPAGLG